MFGLIKKACKLLKSFMQKQKGAILAAGLTALTLDIITGVIFGFGGAALFAAV